MASTRVISDELDKLSASQAFVCDIEDCRFDLPDATLLLTQNIRSVCRNFDGFLIMLQRFTFECDFLILTECWLTESTILPRLDNYNSFRTFRNPLQNDGVIIYVRQNISLISVEEPTINDCNCLIVKIGDHTAVVAIYRSPSYQNPS